MVIPLFCERFFFLFYFILNNFQSELRLIETLLDILSHCNMTYKSDAL